MNLAVANGQDEEEPERKHFRVFRRDCGSVNRADVRQLSDEQRIFFVLRGVFFGNGLAHGTAGGAGSNSGAFARAGKG